MAEFSLIPKEAWTVVNAALKKPAKIIGDIISIPLRWIRNFLVWTERLWRNRKSNNSTTTVDLKRSIDRTDDLSDDFWGRNNSFEMDKDVVKFICD